MELKDVIKNARLEARMTQKELGQKCGVSESTVSRWEKGDVTTIKHSYLSKLSKALNVDPNLLVPELKPEDIETGMMVRDALKEFVVTNDEKILLTKLRALPTDVKYRIVGQIEAYYDMLRE